MQQKKWRIFITIFGFIGVLTSPLKANAKYLKVDSLQNQLELALKEGQYTLAIELVDQAIPLLEPSTQWADRLAQLYTNKGTALRNLGQYLESLNAHQKALQLRFNHCGRNSVDVASTYLNMGNAYWFLDSLVEARKYYERAKTIKSRQLGDNHPDLAPIYNGLGNIYLLQNNLRAAAFTLTQAYEITLERWPKIPTKYTAYGLNLASVFQAQNKYHKAETLLKQLINAQLTQPQPSHQHLADLYTNLGNLLIAQDHHQAAIQCYDSAEYFFHQLADLPKLSYGNCLQNKGLALMEMGDLNRSIAHFTSALPFLEEDLSGQAAIHQNLGLTYLYLKDYEHAKEQFGESLMRYEVLDPNIYKEENGNAHLNLASVFLEDPDESLEFAEYYIKEALKLLPLDELKEQHLMGMHKLGMCYTKMEQFEQAKQLFRKTARWALPDAPFIYCSSLYYQANLAQQQGQLSQAHQMLNQVSSFLNGMTTQGPVFQQFQAQIELTKAQVLRTIAQEKGTANNWVACLDHSLKGIEKVNQLKKQVSRIKSIVTINQDFYQLYDLAIESCFALKSIDSTYSALGFELAEQFKSQVLQYLIPEGEDNGGFNQLRTLKHQLAHSQIQRFQLNQRKESPDLIQAWDLRILALEKRLSEAQPNSPLHQAPHLELQDIQTVLTQDQTLLEYYWGEESLFLFIVNHDSTYFERIDHAENILADIKKVFSWSSQRTEWLGVQQQIEADDDLIKATHELYCQLLAPFQDKISEKLLIVPDGPLALLPFEILLRSIPHHNHQFRNHHYLIKDFEVAYLYPASEMRYWATTKVQQHKGILGIAPTFEEHSQGLQTLNNNIPEVKRILAKKEGIPLIKDQATEKNFRALADQYQVIHLSTHGILNHQHPSFSYIAFQEQLDNEENERLYITEIETLDLSAELVFLSACQSALGKLYRGEGLLSMARSFKMAGAQSLIASLWNVDDKQTPVIIDQFYHHLSYGSSKMTALRKAKLAYIESTSHPKAHPFYWAGFVLHGNPKAIQLEQKWSFWGFIKNLISF